MPVKISKANTKLGLIPSINLPPIITCRSGCPCAKDCYAMKGRFRFSNVKASMENNYGCYKNNPNAYFSDIKKSINNGVISYSYFRWHASGDIVDSAYLDGMIKVATDLPNTKFLAFTKKFEIVNQYIRSGGIIPDNLNIVFSAWGSKLKVDNPYSFPVAYVKFNSGESDSMIPDYASACGGDCTTCLKCWNIKKGQAVFFRKH